MLQRAVARRSGSGSLIEHLGQQLAVLVEELRTVGDPEVAEAQIESVASEAAEHVAGANARATRAEQAQRRAGAEKDEADAAAEEATRTGEELAQELSARQAELEPRPGLSNSPRNSSRPMPRLLTTGSWRNPRVHVCGPTLKQSVGN